MRTSEHLRTLRIEAQTLRDENGYLNARREELAAVRSNVVGGLSATPDRWRKEIDYRLQLITRAQGDNGTRLLSVLHEIAALERRQIGSKIKRFLLLTFIRFVSVLKRLYKKAF